MPDIPQISFGSPVLANQLDALLAECDLILGRLFNGNRSWYAFNTGPLPAQQVPPGGAVYVLSDDADRVVIPVPGTPGAPDGGNWPEQYDHDAHVTAAAALTITGPDDNGYSWITTTDYSEDVYAGGDAASVMEREDTDIDLGTVTLPLRYGASYEHERFHRYALADVFIEASAATEFDWFHDKYGVIRVHNLSLHGVTVNLSDEETLSVPSMGVRCIRRTSRTALWNTDERHYFPKALPGDVPIWDGSTIHMANRPLRSQNSNPIFRVALIQSMFRPQVLADGPGLFSATINDVLTVPGDEGLLAAATIQNGTFDVIRTRTDDPDAVDTYTFTYSGEVLDGVTAEQLVDDLEAIGLTVSHDDTTRGVVIEPDAGFPPPDTGEDWAYDLISRGTNLTGGIVVPVSSSRTLIPWFVDAAAADEWFMGLFHWPTYEVTKSSGSTYWKNGTWTPLGGGADTDYCGSWAQDGSDIEAREWVAEWGSTSIGSVSPWNFFSTTVGDGLTLVQLDGQRDFARLVIHPVFTAVVAEETVSWWSADDDPTWDNATPITPNSGEGPGLYVAGQPIGLGAPADGGNDWTEPRWQLVMLPTIGADPQTSWDALGMHGAEEIIWTPLIPGTGSTTITHWRIKGGDGAASGADWTWNYAGDGFTPIADEPSGEVMSGMSFWRVFAQNSKPPGSADTYDGKPETGPHPWRIRDHGWLADQVLAGAPVAAGDPWSVANVDCFDNADIGGLGPEIRPDEFNVGMQIRMTAATFNSLAALVDGITHVRPCGWENYVHGFPFDDLTYWQGWDLGLGGTSNDNLQPYGAAHVYGVDSTTDDALDALGITRRTAESSTLQALQTIALRKFYALSELPFPFTGFGVEDDDVDESERPGTWSDIGDEIEYCTPDDIHDALSPMGFAFNVARFVQAATIATVIPSESLEVETDTFSGDSADVPGDWFRHTITRTVAVPIPETDDPTLQVVPQVRFKLAPERPMRAQIHIRNLGGGDFSVRRVDPSSGTTADAIERFQRGEWNNDGVLTDAGNESGILWSADLVARTGLTASVMAIPWRKLTSEDRGLDDTGPRAVTVREWSSALVLPGDGARAKWLTVAAGGRVEIGDLAGSSTPTYPDDHHVWELHIVPADLEAL